MREKGVSLNEKKFASECVSQGHRLDGRKLTEGRHVIVKLGPSWGFAEVRYDGTHAIASTTVDAIRPASDRPSEGTLSVSIELSPASSETCAREALYRTTGHQQRFLETRTAVDGFVRDSRALDTEALCILSGVKVWAVRVSVDIVHDDGNCTDVAMMAIMASLLHARRPDVSVHGKEVRVFTMDEREPVPLPVHHLPLAVTFAVFDEAGSDGSNTGGGAVAAREIPVIDPTKLEELAGAGTVSFAFNAQGEVCGVYKAGGLPLQPRTFAQCAGHATERAVELTEVLKKAMQEAAEEHPLATSRPMLVDAEPTAVIRTEILEVHDDEDDADMDTSQNDVPMSTWNAMRVPDEPPPSTKTDPVLGTKERKEKKERRVVDQSLQAAFGSKDTGTIKMDAEDDEISLEKKLNRSVVVGDDDEDKDDEDDKDDVNDDDEEDEDDSSDDDLIGAIVGKGKRKGK